MTGSHPSPCSQAPRCQECLCGIENDHGIWCAHLKRIPRPREVRRCRHFCPEVILNETYDPPV